MKTCSKCKIAKEAVEFYASKLTLDGLHSRCRRCCNEQSRAHYQANRVTRLKKTKLQTGLRKQAAQRFVVEYLRSHPCVDCGEPDIIVLDFDHVRGQKTENIGSMVSYGRPTEKIEAEIRKCDVRCANCHRRMTATRGGHYRSKLIPA